jgi:hypothetical protein
VNGWRRTAAVGVLAVAVALLVASAARRHAVYDRDAAEFGIELATNVSERVLVADTTFRGVELRDGRLYSTYDRSQPVGKRACPT